MMIPGRVCFYEIWENEFYQKKIIFDCLRDGVSGRSGPYGSRYDGPRG